MKMSKTIATLAIVTAMSAVSSASYAKPALQQLSCISVSTSSGGAAVGVVQELAQTIAPVKSGFSVVREWKYASKGARIAFMAECQAIVDRVNPIFAASYQQALKPAAPGYLSGCSYLRPTGMGTPDPSGSRVVIYGFIQRDGTCR